MKETCDMHIHTNCSDGNLSPSQLLEYAREKNLKKLAITDHDCVDFYFDEEASYMLKHFDYVTGCEFVCSYGMLPIEIIGYGIDVRAAKEYLDVYGVNENRVERYRSDNIPKVFAKHGIALDYHPESVDFSQKCPMVLEKIYDIVLKNPNILKSVSTFLREGLNNPKSKIFIEPHKLYPSYDKITTLIKKLGGLSFLAHPYQYGNSMDDVLNELKDYVDGIECYHYTTLEPEKSEYLKDFCKNNGLMISGGSDFHVQDKGNDLLNGLDISEQYFDEIKKRLNKNVKKYL